MKILSILTIAILIVACNHKKEIEIEDFNSKCIKSYLKDVQLDTIKNNFLKIDSLKPVDYSEDRQFIYVSIYTDFDCVYEGALKPYFRMEGQSLVLYARSEHKGIASSCVCPSIINYKVYVGNQKRKDLVIYYRGLLTTD